VEVFELLCSTYPAVENLFFRDELWATDPHSGNGRLIPRKSLEWLLVPVGSKAPNERASKNSMSTIVKEWDQLHKEGLGRNVDGWGHHVMLTEEEAVRLLWFIHRHVGTPRMRVRVLITKVDSYKGPVYTQYQEPERREESVFIDEAVRELVKKDDLTGIYFKEVAETDLLIQEEEIELAKRIERGKRAQELLEIKGRNLSSMVREKHELLIKDGQAARDHLIKANGRLVISIARKYIGGPVPFLDLIQEGNIGLMTTVEKFDWRRGLKFSTYATWWIRQAITRAVAEKGRTIRLPVYMHDEIGRMVKVVRRFVQEWARRPTPEEIAEIMGHKLPKVKLMLRAATLPVSLATPAGEDEEGELGDFIEDENARVPMDSVSENMMRDKIEEVLATLSPREARIIRLRFGLYNGPALTLEEIGVKFGVSRERIRQIEGKALRRLRHPRRSRTLRDYHEL